MCPSVSGQNYWRTRYNNRDSGVCLDSGPDASCPPAPSMHNVAPDRWHLYLPRNLSFCEECRRETEEHVRRKAKLLDDYLHKHHPEMLGSGVFRPFPAVNLRKRSVYSSPIAHDVTFFLGRRDSTASVDENSSTSDCSNVSSGFMESPGCDGDKSNKIRWDTKSMPVLEEEQLDSMRNRSCLMKKQPYRSVDSLFRAPQDDDEYIRRRKVVRFADAIGLELEHVRYLMRVDEPAKIKSLKSASKIGSFSNRSLWLSAPEFVPQFAVPRLKLAFSPERGSVYLEQLELPGGSSSTIFGRVRVENIDFEKRVSVRFTIDNWKTQKTQTAHYLLSYGDGRSDAFGFTLFLPRTSLIAGSELQFAIRCEFPKLGKVHWDNNKDANYTILIVDGSSSCRSHATHGLSHAL